MTTRRIIELIIAVVLAMGGTWAAMRVQLQDIDTRERLNSAAAEHAIERVARESTEKIDKIDANVQWLIKEQIETKALLRRAVGQ